MGRIFAFAITYFITGVVTGLAMGWAFWGMS